MAQSKRKPRAKKQTDRVGDQNIIKGNITGGITTQGRNAKVVVHQQGGADIGELNSLFKQLYQHIESRPEDPNIGKEEITQTVQNLEAESAKGDQANQTKMDRWMANLEQMAPDIVDVILACLGGPLSGITAVLRKIAERARDLRNV